MGQDDVYPVKMFKVGLLHYFIAELGDGMHQWLLLQFLVLLMTGAESFQNM